MCRHCAKPFVHQQCLRAHEEGCVEKLVSRASSRKTAVLLPSTDLAEDQVHSDASLSSGQGNLFRGQENKELCERWGLQEVPKRLLSPSRPQ